MTTRLINIRFTTDKNGKRRAHYWGLAKRWLPISIAEAELRLATGRARMNTTTADLLPVGYRQTSIEGDVWSVR